MGEPNNVDALTTSAKRRTPVRVVLGLVVLGALLVLIALLLFRRSLFDVPRVEAPDLRPIRIEIPDEQNVLPVLLALAEEEWPDSRTPGCAALWDFEEAYTEDRLEEFLAGEHWPELREKWWEPSTALLDRLESSFPGRELVYPPPHLGPDGVPTHPWIGGLKSAVGIAMQREWIASTRSEEDHLDAVFGLGRIAIACDRSSNALMVEVLFHHAISYTYHAGVDRFLRRSPSRTSAAGVLNQLLELAVEPERYAEALRWEYVIAAEQLRRFAENEDWSEPDGVLPEVGVRVPGVRPFLPERSVALLTERMRTMISEWDETGRVTPPPGETEIDGEWALLREGNPVGRAFVALMLPTLAKAHESSNASRGELHAARAQAAAYLYEIDHGHLPDTLAALVPEYLPTVPIEPWTREPIRYDRDRRIVWSLGADGVDDGGVQERRGGPDLVREIPTTR